MAVLDPHAQRLIEMLSLRGASGSAAMTVAERRTAFRNLMSMSGPLAPVGGIENAVIQGPNDPIPVRRYIPLDASSALPGLVYLHGGGLVAGDLETHDVLCRIIANGTRCCVIAVDYRRAPEHPFPAALEDALAAVTWVFASAAALGVDANRIGIAGDSAGGTLAAVVAATLRRDHAYKLAFQLLLCPILDFAGQTPSRTAFETPVLDRAMLDRDIALYIDGITERSDPRVSPLRADDFVGLPPTFIHTAECDPLRDEGHIYAEALARSGVEVHHTCHPGMPHLFYAMTGVIPSSRTALRAICAELDAMLRQLDTGADHKRTSPA